MALETASYVGGLVAANPLANDPKSQGDDHLRLIKAALLNTFAGFTGMVVVAGTEAQGATANDYTVTVSPAPAAYTTSMLVVFKAAHTNIGAATVQVNALGTKPLLDVDGNAMAAGAIASGALVLAYYDGTSFYAISANGLQTAPTPATGDVSARLATAQFVARDFAPLASPALTGTPTCPTPAAVASKQVVNAEFVLGLAYASVTLPILQGQAVSADSAPLMTAACYRSIRNTGVTGNLYILPDARTLNVGVAYEFFNDNTCVLMANDGTYLGSSSLPAGLCRLWLINNATQAGTWSVSAAQAMTALSAAICQGNTVAITSSLTSGNAQVVARQLDSTRTLLIYSTAKNASATSGVWAVVVTSSFALGKPVVTAGTPVQISGGANVGTDGIASAVAVAQIDTEKFALGWMEQGATSALTPKAVVITTSGMGVSVGAAIGLHASYAAGFSGAGPQFAVHVVSHATGAFVASYYDANTKNLYASVCVVSGTTIAQGPEYTVKTLNPFNANYSPRLLSVALSPSLVVFGYCYDVGNANATYASAATINGNTLAPGASVTLAAGGAGPFALAKLSASSALLVNNASNFAMTIAGNTITAGAAVAHDGVQQSIGVVSPTQVFTVGQSATGYNWTISGTTISAGTPATFAASSTAAVGKDNGAVNGSAMIFPDNVVDIATVARRGALDSSSLYVASPTAANSYALSAWMTAGTTLNVRAVKPTYALI